MCESAFLWHDSPLSGILRFERLSPAAGLFTLMTMFAIGPA